MTRYPNIFALLLALVAAGCQQAPVHPQGFSLDHGAQLLSSGSPKSAIPFLTQTVASVPDGPEPIALLSLAYALDLQDARAILQAEKVHRAAGDAPGWEAVAVGIARMSQNRHGDAIASFARIPSDAPAALAARQWMILAQLQSNQTADAVVSLDSLATSDALCVTASLWLVLVHEQQGNKEGAIAALKRCAQVAATPSGESARQLDLTNADAQTLYDAGIASLTHGDLAQAQSLLSRVRDRTPDACDTAIWLALIVGIQENWQACRNQLADACEKGPSPSRGLASQLFSVVCALEDRPEAVIKYTLLGQRLLDRGGEPGYIHEQPKPESVWMSDQMH